MNNLLDDAFNEKPLKDNKIIFATFWARPQYFTSKSLENAIFQGFLT